MGNRLSHDHRFSAEYAKLRGVSRKTVSQWKKDGKLTLSDGGVDVEATDEFLERYRRAG